MAQPVQRPDLERIGDQVRACWVPHNNQVPCELTGVELDLLKFQARVCGEYTKILLKEGSVNQQTPSRFTPWVVLFTELAKLSFEGSGPVRFVDKTLEWMKKILGNDFDTTFPNQVLREFPPKRSEDPGTKEVKIVPVEPESVRMFLYSFSLEDATTVITPTGDGCFLLLEI